MTARIRVSLCWRCCGLSRMAGSPGPGGVDLGDDAGGAVVFGLRDVSFRFPGRTEVTEERLGAFGMLGPDGPVAGVVGGLRAAG